MKSKWHNISIKTESFEELQEIQRTIPIRVSIPQTIEWLIKVGQQQIKVNYTMITPEGIKRFQEVFKDQINFILLTR